MHEEEFANILSIIIPYILVILGILTIIAIIWGVCLMIKKLQRNVKH